MTGARPRLLGRSRPGGGLALGAVTPMVDVLTIVLVVLLRTWSTDPPVIVPEAGFELPYSRSESGVGRGVVVDVGRSGLYVEGWRVGSATYWAASDEVLVREVYEALQAAGGTSVLVRADGDVPWVLLGKVMFTAQQAGCSQLQLVAASRASL